MRVRAGEAIECSSIPILQKGQRGLLLLLPRLEIAVDDEPDLGAGVQEAATDGAAEKDLFGP